MRIKQKLFWAFVFFGVGPLLVMVAVGIGVSRGVLLRAYSELLRQTGDAVQRQLETMARQWEADAGIWAHSDATLRTFETGDPKFVSDFLEIALDHRSVYRVAIVVRPDHRVAAVGTARPDDRRYVEGLIGQTIESAPWYSGVAAAGRTPTRGAAVVVAPASEFERLAPGAQIWLFARSLIEDEFGDAQGVLILGIPAGVSASQGVTAGVGSLLLDPTAVLRAGSGSVTELAAPGSGSSYVVVYDETGTFVFSSNRAGAGNRASLEQLIGSHGVEAGRTMSGVGLHGESVLVQVADNYQFNAIATLGWRIAVVVSETEAFRPARLLGVTVLLVACLVVFVAGLFARVIVGRQVQPILELAHSAQNVVRNRDLTISIEPRGEDEIAVLAGSFKQMVEQQRAILTSFRGLTSDLVGLGGRALDVGASVSANSTTIHVRLHEASTTARSVIASMGEVSEKIAALHADAEGTMVAAQQIDGSTQRVERAVESMAVSVDSTAVAIEEISVATRESARSVSEFRTFVDATSKRMVEMDAETRKVEDSASNTAKLSALVSSEAAAGNESLRRTLESLERISAASARVADTTKRLSERVSEIASLLDVITEVAQKTHLLSINSAIIAAQAGDQGRSFHVVAAEIKLLAERTRQSSMEITQMIDLIRVESEGSVEAIDEGLRVVKDGVELGHSAATTLGRILTSAQEAADMVGEIAEVTQRQASNYERVMQSIGTVLDTVDDLAHLSNNQAAKTAQIARNTVALRDISDAVRSATQMQIDGSMQVGRAVSQMATMVRELRNLQERQAHSSSSVLEAVTSVAQMSDEESHDVHQLVSAIEELQRQALVLKREMEGFRL